jgi:hypothetical protein
LRESEVGTIFKLTSGAASFIFLNEKQQNTTLWLRLSEAKPRQAIGAQMGKVAEVGVSHIGGSTAVIGGMLL